jgi:hypothetical protein
VRPKRNAAIDYTDSHWIYREKTTDVPSPLYYNERLYFVNGARGSMMCVDPATGEEIWNEDLDSRPRIWASPTASDNKIYCYNEEGETVVVSGGEAFEVIARNEALPGDGPSKSTIAIAHGNLFIRTGTALYCIGD